MDYIIQFKQCIKETIIIRHHTEFIFNLLKTKNYGNY